MTRLGDKKKEEIKIDKLFIFTNRYNKNIKKQNPTKFFIYGNHCTINAFKRHARLGMEYLRKTEKKRPDGLQSIIPRIISQWLTAQWHPQHAPYEEGGLQNVPPSFQSVIDSWQPRLPQQENKP